MFRKFRKYISFGFIFATALTTSCSDESTIKNIEGKKDFEIRITYQNDPFKHFGRAVIQPENNQDSWSYREFTIGDILGFYSAIKKDPRNPYVNVPMMLSEISGDNVDNLTYKFIPSVDMKDFDPAGLSGSGIFMYFPYFEGMPALNENNKPGMPLRVKEEPFSNTRYNDGPWRCVDFLTSTEIDATDLENGTLTGQLIHSFSELIIMRGEGFDKPMAPKGEDEYKITIKLKKPFTHIRVKCSTPYAVTTELYNDKSYTPEGMNHSDFDASVWEAWKGGNYAETQEDLNGRDAWYVILPTIGSGNKDLGAFRENERSEVEYIRLYDNQGVEQTIKDLHLSGSAGNMLDAQWRYPMVVAMQELVPTVFPVTITPWNEDTITNRRTRSITQDKFLDWVNDYNTFISSNRKTVGKLSQYGDKITYGTNPDDYYWHFYLADDINLGALSQNFTGNTIINKLEDVLDGKTTAMQNPITISGLTKPFIDVMSGSRDTLMNIKIDHPAISSDATPLGVIVNTLDGVITNCTVSQGHLSGPGIVGMFCGDFKAGELSKNTASGIIIGSSSNNTYGFLLGQISGNAIKFIDNNSTVTFSNTQNP